MGWHLEKTTEKLKTVNSERDALTMPKLPLPDAPMFLNIPSVPDSIQYQTQVINSSTKMKSPKSGTKYHQYDSPYN